MTLQINVIPDHHKYTLDNGRLVIRHPEAEDFGYYRCEASNTEGTIVSNYARLAHASKY